MSSRSETQMTIARPVLASLLLALVALACNKSNLLPGRCDKASDCSGTLTCDDHRTCVPSSGGQPPCSSSAACGEHYVCDNLQWCVCAVPTSGSDDPCTNGSLPTYRGVGTDGGMDGGDGGDGG